jgi:hypothetical protein
MQKPYFLLAIFSIAALLAGCASKTAAGPEAARALEELTPTDSPEVVMPESVPSVPPETLSDDPPASCPVTQAPEIPFVAPAPYPAAPPERYAGEFWYGTPELWTMLGTDPVWRGLPYNRRGYSQKLFWWSQDFDVSEDPYPAFRLIIQQVDVASAPILVAEEATNASADFGTAMLTGVEIPAPGCWTITGQYQQSELSFVVWVVP